MNALGTIRMLALLGWMAIAPRLAAAEPQPWLWPVEGAAAGEGILFAPQTYIAGELNFGSLYIGAAEGTPVVAPADGIVETFGFTYSYSLVYQIGSGISAGEDIASRRKELAAELGGKEDPRYIHISICIRVADGRRLWIGGLDGERIFRTGERVGRGEPLGRVAYSYKGIAEPSISVSVSDRRGRSDDPMTPFGIRTTFLPPQEIPTVTELTREEATEDFTTLMRVLREAYPGLYDDATPAEIEAFCDRTLASLPAKMPIRDFYKVLRRVESRFHDSHLTLYPLESERNRRRIDLPQIYFGWIDSALVAFRCTKPYASYYGRRIRSVDGIAADSLRGIIGAYAYGYDGKVRSVRDFQSLMAGWSRYFSFVPDASERCDVTLEFDDGERLALKGWTYTGRDLHGLAPDWTEFVRTNNYPDADFSLRTIDDSTAYMGLSTFQLHAVEVDSLAAFIRSVADKPNLIVDLRNNSGGEIEVLRRILSFFATKPFAPLGGYQWIAAPEGIRSFEGCCMNYLPDQQIVGGFEPVEGKEGYFLPDDVGDIVPDSATHYGGRLYVLINEGSASAATIFPAVILRNHRGVIVGRETATAYHFMNAVKFADIRLPHSWVTMRVPLVRCVFDTTRNERIPYGRGVIPDHEVRLTLDELASVRGDSILNYTLALIDRGEYLGEDPFAVDPEPVSLLRHFAGAAAVVALVTAVIAAIALGRRRRKKK